MSKAVVEKPKPRMTREQLRAEMPRRAEEKERREKGGGKGGRKGKCKGGKP